MPDKTLISLTTLQGLTVARVSCKKKCLTMSLCCVLGSTEKAPKEVTSALNDLKDIIKHYYAVLATAEQDIIKHEASGTALRPGPGASQQSGWRTAQRYCPYERRDHRSAGAEQEQ